MRSGAGNPSISDSQVAGPVTLHGFMNSSASAAEDAQIVFDNTKWANGSDDVHS